MDLTTKKQIFLRKGDLIKVTPNSTIVVGSGTVWVTFAGIEKDYVVKTGERLECFAANPMVEAIESSYILICEEPSKMSLLGLLGDWSEEGLR